MILDFVIFISNENNLCPLIECKPISSMQTINAHMRGRNSVTGLNVIVIMTKVLCGYLKPNVIVLCTVFLFSSCGIPGTPESIPTPSNGTSTHSPFSGLDSDFPGVMSEDGLDFDPLQFSPSKSPESNEILCMGFIFSID